MAVNEPVGTEPVRSPTQTTSIDQPIGESVPDWQPAPPPPDTPMVGSYCRLERVEASRHLIDLWDAFAGHDELWTYMPFGPFANEDEFAEVLDIYEQWDGLKGFTIIDEAGKAVGLAAYLRMAPSDGSIEVGAIVYAPSLQQTTAATEAMYLMAKRAFDCGYRRYEWKCDSLNAPSQLAAARLGFTYEGIFRQALVYKGRNRDTAWYSIIDREWSTVGRAMELWLRSDNFDGDGRQLRSLAAIRSRL